MFTNKEAHVFKMRQGWSLKKELRNGWAWRGYGWWAIINVRNLTEDCSFCISVLFPPSDWISFLGWSKVYSMWMGELSFTLEKKKGRKAGRCPCPAEWVPARSGFALLQRDIVERNQLPATVSRCLFFSLGISLPLILLPYWSYQERPHRVG